MSIGSPLVVFYMTSIVSNTVSLTAFEVFDVQFWPRFITVQGHTRSWCQSIAQGGFILTFIDPIMVSVTILEISDIKTISLKEQWWRLIPLPVWRICFFRISTKTIGNHTSRDSTLVASLVKISGGLRSVERSTRFVWQSDWLTHRQTDSIICPMLLMHWTDNKRILTDY